MNPILAIVTPLLVVFAVSPKVAQNRFVGYGVLLVILAYWVLRNLVC